MLDLAYLGADLPDKFAFLWHIGNVEHFLDDVVGVLVLHHRKQRLTRAAHFINHQRSSRS